MYDPRHVVVSICTAGIFIGAVGLVANRVFPPDPAGIRSIDPISFVYLSSLAAEIVSLAAGAGVCIRFMHQSARHASSVTVQLLTI